MSIKGRVEKLEKKGGELQPVADSDAGEELFDMLFTTAQRLEDHPPPGNSSIMEAAAYLLAWPDDPTAHKRLSEASKTNESITGLYEMVVGLGSLVQERDGTDPKGQQEVKP